jgi:hypothetical protein
MSKLTSSFDRRWPTFLANPIQVSNHIITVPDTQGLLHPKQLVYLNKTGLEQLELEIKRVISDTQIQVGPVGKDMATFSNPTSYSGGTLTAWEQQRNPMGMEIFERASHAEDPINAKRSILVDKYGQYAEFVADENGVNRLAVDANITIKPEVSLDVDLTHTNDSVRLGDGTNFLTSHTVGTDIGLDVYFLNSSIDVGNFPATQTVNGTVDVGNFPATQTVNGTVDVGNFPATQTVNGTVDVGNFPATQTVNGTVDVGNFPATQTVNGTVDVGNFPATQTVNGTVTANQGTNPWVVSGSVFTTPGVGTLDAFARQRVSEPYTLGDYKHLYGIDPNFIDYTLNGGTISFQSNKACARLTTSSDVNSKAIHQTKCYHHYMPGKSQLIMSSFNFYSSTSGVTKRTGLFDDNNGIYFEQTGNGTLNIVLRSYINGAVNENRVSQLNWNVDKCDGTGISSLNLDITKTQLLFIDFQWLGVGRVRVGFSHEGKYIEAHHFDGENNLTTVYMSNPNLPVRCEIFNTGVTTGAYMDQICSTVVSEGGYVEAGIDWALASPTPRLLGTGQTLPILAIRLKNNYKTYLNRMLARLGQVTVFTDSGNVQFSIAKLQNASNLTGGAGVWTSTNSESGVEYLANATGYTNADILSVGFAASASQGGSKAGSDSNAVIPSSAKKNYIVQNFDSTNSEVYVIIVKNIDTKATNISAGLQWREIY